MANSELHNNFFVNKFGNNDEDASDVATCVRCTKFASYVCQMCGDFYCSPACRRLDWHSHRYICRKMPKLVMKEVFDNEIMKVGHPLQEVRGWFDDNCAEYEGSANNSFKFVQNNQKLEQVLAIKIQDSNDNLYVCRSSLQRRQASLQLHSTEGQYGKIGKQQFNHNGQQGNDGEKGLCHCSQHHRDGNQQHGDQFDNNEPYRQANDVQKRVNEGGQQQHNSDSALKRYQLHVNSGNEGSQNYDDYEQQQRSIDVQKQPQQRNSGQQQRNNDAQKQPQQRNSGHQQRNNDIPKQPQQRNSGQRQRNNDAQKQPQQCNRGQRQRNNDAQKQPQQRNSDRQQRNNDIQKQPQQRNSGQRQRNNDIQQQQQQRNKNVQPLRSDNGQQQQRNYNGQQDQNIIVVDQVLNADFQKSINDRRSGNEGRQWCNHKSQHDMPQQNRLGSRNISNSNNPEQSNANQNQNQQNYSKNSQSNYQSYQTNQGRHNGSQQERQSNKNGHQGQNIDRSTISPVLKPPFEIIKLDENDTNFQACVIDTSCIREGVFACIPDKDYTSFIEMQIFLTKMDKGGQAYKPVLNEYCIALFEEDWYRAKVIGAYGNEFKVEYIDFTNQDFVKTEDIRRYPLGLTGVNSTSLCKLAGLPDKLGSKLSNQLENMIVNFQRLHIQTVKKFDKYFEIECPVLLKQLSELGFI